MAKRRKELRPMDLVKFDLKNVPEGIRNEYPFRDDESYVYLGDINQMPGHCLVVRMENGQVFCGFHTSNFIRILDDEA